MDALAPEARAVENVRASAKRETLCQLANTTPEIPGGGSKVLDCCDQQLPDLTRHCVQGGIIDG